MTDPMKDVFDTLNQSTPAPKNMAENKAVFMATAHRMSVTSEKLARHQQVNANYTKGVLPMKLRFNRRVSVLVALFAVLTVAGGVLANSIFGFFNQAPSDTNNLQITYGEVDMENLQLTMPTFFNTVAEALASTPYDAKAPQSLPAGYQFGTATYVANSGDLSQNYQCGDSGITFSQRPLADGEIFGGAEVGASATIIPVNIGDGGEYVRGGWVTDGDTPTIVFDSSMVNTTTNVDLTWSNDLPQHALVWTENGMRYSIMTSPTKGGCNLTQADILAIANSLK